MFVPRPGERLPLVARRDWFPGSSGNSRPFSSNSPTTVRLWPLEIRLLCVGLRQESRGGGRSQRATPTHLKGSRPLRGGEWEVLVEDWTGQPRPDPGDGCRALSCLPGELWRVPRKLIPRYSGEQTGGRVEGSQSAVKNPPAMQEP